MISGIALGVNDDRRHLTLAALRARYQALSVSKQVDVLHLMARG